MPCNSGVSLIPIVNGKVDKFGARGLFNGLALLGDDRTGSYWDHITGECVHGPLKGAQLSPSPYELLYTTVAAAQQSHPRAQIAISQTSMRERFRLGLMRIISPVYHKVMGNRLPSRFTQTMIDEDTRRPRMDLGLGVWTATQRRYYPLAALRSQPNGVLDQLGKERLFLWYNPEARAAEAFFTSATRTEMAGGEIVFDTGERLRNGVLIGEDGQPTKPKRPQQMLTRWYGFAYTFPKCEIYEPSE